MINDFSQIILLGGITRCTNRWNKLKKTTLDDCLKIYLPFDGSATISFTKGCVKLLPDKIYLINGTKLTAQRCDHFMDLAWIHFTPVSLKLKYTLYKYLTACQWNYSQIPFTKKMLETFGKSFADNKGTLKTQPREKIIRSSCILELQDHLSCKLQSFITYLLSEVLQEHSLKIKSEEIALLNKMSPAIEFMDRNYLTNPPLKKIAETVFMAPNYFHRFFTQSFGISPFKYMLDKRLSNARQMLSTTTRSVKEIALACGYENEFYFSRIFKKYLNLSPSQLRKNEWSA